MIEDVDLSPRDRALYEKLHASHGDLGIASSCAHYILKKGWHTLSFLRRGSVPLQQTAFTTTMIVAYARPFAGGRGKGISFPERLLQYDPGQTAFHKRLLKLRSQEYAHTDASTISVRPLKGSVVTDIQSIRDISFSPDELKLLIDMTQGVSGRIRQRLDDIRRSGS
ncbi:hypothetical protein TSA1_26630 [Bradyrhizobium nitroreducens]|uniref:Uncharacterized protein n=1 Tax=Bradyrhizobium nitroreducens TaxID=709803 RepID=A0A2M6UHF7_9BRAD|nr:MULTISPECIES: hypothetical protein [Bradyrhizobium]MBJ7402183.1 hypothetical protein [Bradyrhizobium sp.]MBR0926318.1 hypothetical protein [Bradyrhizobium diazoefficiens]PIT03947.1 hypothetical protein TSA1_26630 [Bradyrhizobium nitroreducens]